MHVIFGTIKVWAKISGTDISSRHRLIVCLNKPVVQQTNKKAAPQTTKKKEPQVGHVPGDAQIQAFDTKLLTQDGVFNVETGLTGMKNNWLLMTEQVAKVSHKSNCVVCMGSRPILRVVSTVMENETSDCILDVMSKDNPSDDCAKYDMHFPVTERRCCHF